MPKMFMHWKLTLSTYDVMNRKKGGKNWKRCKIEYMEDGGGACAFAWVCLHVWQKKNIHVYQYSCIIHHLFGILRMQTTNKINGRINWKIFARKNLCMNVNREIAVGPWPTKFSRKYPYYLYEFVYFGRELRYHHFGFFEIKWQCTISNEIWSRSPSIAVSVQFTLSFWMQTSSIQDDIHFQLNERRKT